MDFDDAFANAAYIADGESYPDKWAIQARSFRQQALCELDIPYGEGARQKYDLFHPPRLAKGVVVFVHGGYWLRFEKSFWSHLAAGPLAHGWAVAIPSYDLCPAVRVAQIAEEISSAIDAISTRVLGPIRLVGHSAGGQLVARMASPATIAPWSDLIAGVVPVSPVADLTDLMQTSMNTDLKITPAEAQSESPVFLPAPQKPTKIWVGAQERPVFLQQAKSLSSAWTCALTIEPAKHHFDVIEALSVPGSALTHAVVGVDGVCI